MQYAGASGDYNPLHTDEVYSVHAGYQGVFAHGMLTMGLTGKMLTNYVGDGRLTKFGVRFTNQVWPGDTLDATATVAAIREEDGEHSSTSPSPRPTRTARKWWRDRPPRRWIRKGGVAPPDSLSRHAPLQRGEGRGEGPLSPVLIIR